jgi:hypothetical protein
MTQNDPPEGQPSQRGPAVDGAEELLRAITPGAAAVWFPNGALSSAAFNHPIFSVDILSLTTITECQNRWEAGTGFVSFLCSVAQQLDFDVRHEPENANYAHANVYSGVSSNKRKGQARKLAAACQVLIPPIPPSTP